MYRKLFFFLERLQITRKERLSIGFLALCLIILGTLNLMIERKAAYDPAYYEELERVFGERSRMAEAGRNEIMARYRPFEEPRPGESPLTISPDKATIRGAPDSIRVRSGISRAGTVRSGTARTGTQPAHTGRSGPARSDAPPADTDAVQSGASPSDATTFDTVRSGAARDDTSETSKADPDTTAAGEEDGALVNINKAGVDELQLLPGIGPAYADRIIRWREENGRFTSVDQLLEIRGIGEKRLEALEPLVRMKE